MSKIRRTEEQTSWTLSADSARHIREAVAANVRRARERSGLSQRELAAVSRVGEDTVARLEKAQQEPRLATLVAFSFALGVPLDVLLCDLPSPPKCVSRPG